MDKPPIDLEKLKKLKAPKKTREEEYLEWCAAQEAQEREEAEYVAAWEALLAEREGKEKPPASLTDPYYNRRQIIDVRDFDEWG